MRYLVILATLLIAGCGNQATQPAIPEAVDQGRFSYTYHGYLRCGYEDRESRRAIYTITDTTTGVEYLAVQGLGTSQLVREQHGKTSSNVER